MRFANMAAAVVLCLFSGLIVPGYAQHDEKQEKQGGKPEQRAEPRQQQRTQQPQGQERAPQAQQQPQRQEHTPQAQQQPQRQEHAPQARQQPERAQQAPQRTPTSQQPPQVQPQQRAQQPRQQERAPQAQQQPQRAPQAPQQQRTQVPQQRAQQPEQQPRQQAQQPQTQQRSILPHTQQPQRSRQQAQSWQQQRGWLKQGGGWQGHDNFRQDSSRSWNSDHRTWAQRGGYGGYYIPQNTFNLYFGRQHFFRFQAPPVMYLGYPRFEYEGTSFLLLDPWPANWSQDWYSADDLYIDYADDGYYLYNRDYPQQRLAITILV